MVTKKRYHIMYAPEVYKHLKSIERKHYGLIRSKIQEQLEYSPDIVTRNRKPLDSLILADATWELRFGSQNCFRVFYDIDYDNFTVDILAIGIKTRNRLVIGKEVIQP